MVLDPPTFEGLGELCDHIGEAVDEDVEQRTREARGRFRTELSLDGGKIDPMDSPDIYSASENTLINLDHSHRTMYGIDGSTVPPRRFMNGMIVGLATASCAMLGDGDRSIEDTARLVGTVYHRTGEIALESGRIQNGDRAIDVEIVGEGNRESGVEDWVRSTALGLSEARHAQSVAPRLDGPLFLDGGIYPAYVLPEIAFRRNRYGPALEPDGEAAASVSAAVDTVQGYVDAIRAVVNNGYPVIGCTKTLRTSMMAGALEAKASNQPDPEPVPWERDDQFLGQVLHTSEPEEVTWTTWFEQTALPQDDNHDPLEGFDLGPDESLADYRRAFFFVRVPTGSGPGGEGGVVFRAEVPRMLVDTKQARNRLQAFIIREIAEAEGPPMVIQRADDQARISEETRKQLFNRLDGGGISRDFNRDVRF